jgi:diguanylate cyclase (GGDEF)-like protein
MFCRVGLAPDEPSGKRGDDLTGLGSRSFFHRAAGRRIELYRRNGLPLACAVLDVDDFKSYNDRYGHEGGDKALRCVARVLLESTRADDLVARYGGEEFVVLMGGDVEDAITVAERVRERVEFDSVSGDEISLGSSLTVSVGVAPLTDETLSLEQLVRAADGELYRAKRAGKNRVAAVGRRSGV